MYVNIEIKHVNGMSKPKVTIEDGTISYVLPFEVQLPPGTFDRITNLFRQRIPVQLTISSPQAKMDLFTEVFTDTPGASFTEEEIVELRIQAKDALRTSESAEFAASESGDAGDLEVADAAAATAAEAVTKAAAALDYSDGALLESLGEEVHAEILAEGEMQAESIAAEEGAAAFDALSAEEREAIPEMDQQGGDPVALRKEIDEHAAEEEAAVENPGSGRKARKTKAPAV